MEYCVNYDDGTHCLQCGECGKDLCKEAVNSPCSYCGLCE